LNQNLYGTKLLQRGGAKDQASFIPALVHFPVEVPALAFFRIRKMLSILPSSWLGVKKTGTVFFVIPNRLPRPRYWMNYQLCGDAGGEVQSGFASILSDRVFGHSERNSPELGEDDAMESRLSHNSPPEIPGSYPSRNAHTMSRTVAA